MPFSLHLLLRGLSTSMRILFVIRPPILHFVFCIPIFLRKFPIFMNLLKISIDMTGKSWYTEAVIPT
jgi:hypothetical protein